MARAGRPRIGDQARKIPMRRDQVDAIRTIAAVEGISMASVIRRAIDNEIRRFTRRGRSVA